MQDLNLMVKAAGVAVRSHMRRPPHSGGTRTKKAQSTMALAAGSISPHVDIMKHLSGAVGKGADELAHYYKGLSQNVGMIQGHAALGHRAAATAQQAAAAPAAAVSRMVKRTPTQAINPQAVLAHAANTMPQQVIQGAVKGHAPAMGTSTLLDQLSRTSFDKLGMFRALNKLAGIADHPYMGAAGEKAKGVAMRYGIPAVLGGLHGAESVPDAPLAGAVGGASGGVLGMEVGARTGREIGERMSHPMAPTIGALIGAIGGYRMGSDIGIRGARVLTR